VIGRRVRLTLLWISQVNVSHLSRVAKSLNLETVVKQVVFYGKQLPNMIVDEKHFPLMVMGERAIIFRGDGIQGVDTWS
jgi:hypothetical protein